MPEIDLEYQVSKHLATAMRQWPFLDEFETEQRIRASLSSGNSWLYYQPTGEENGDCDH